MAGTFFNGVQTFFEVVDLGAELAIEALGFDIQLVLLFDFVFKLDDGGNAAFAKPSV